MPFGQTSITIIPKGGTRIELPIQDFWRGEQWNRMGVDLALFRSWKIWTTIQEKENKGKKIIDFGFGFVTFFP